MHEPGLRCGNERARPGEFSWARIAPFWMAACSVLPAMASAQPTTSQVTLTLAEAVEEALATHPSMQAVLAGEDAARSHVGIAKSHWIPQLALNASATRFQEPMLVYPIHGFTPETIPPFSRTIVTGSVGLDFTLFDGGARGSRIHAARAEVSVAGAEKADTTQDLTQRVVSTYVNVLGRKQLLEAHDRRLEALQAELARVRQVLDTGRAARVDLLRAEAELHRAEADRVDRAADLELSELELARLLGTREDSIAAERLLPVSLIDSLVPPRDSLIAVAVRSNAELQRARAALEEAEAQAALARASRWPELGLFARGQAWTDTEGNDTAEWNAGVQLGYPLFTGRARHHRIAAADAAAREAEARLGMLQLEIERHVDAARSDAEEARARTASLRTAVARFSEVQRIRLLALDTGTGTQTDYLDAEADLLDARARLIEARYREIASRSALAWNTGQLDLEWLRRNLENR